MKSTFAVALFLSFVLLASSGRPSMAYDLPGMRDVGFQEAVAAWLADDDAAALGFHDLARSGNPAAAAMILHLTADRGDPGAPLSGVAGFQNVHGAASISTTRSRMLDVLGGGDPVVRSVLVLLAPELSSDDEVWAARLMVLRAGLDDLAFRSLDELSLARAEELMAILRLPLWPPRLQSLVYEMALEAPRSEFSDWIIRDGVNANTYREPRAYWFRRALGSMPVEERKRRGIHLLTDPMGQSLQAFMAGYELSNRATHSGNPYFEAFLRHYDKFLNAWVSRNHETAVYRPFCDARCGETAPNCVRAAFAAFAHDVPMEDLIRAPDGIVDREVFLSSPRGLRLMEEAMRRSFPLVPKVGAPPHQGIYAYEFREISSCLTRRLLAANEE